MNEEWYAKRDRRTDNCSGINSSYKNAVVRIIVTENIKEYRVQLITYFTLTILARWCRNIVFEAFDTPCLIENANGSFHSFIFGWVKKIDPYCQIIFDKSVGSLAGITLYIGSPHAGTDGDFVSVNASGWLSCCAMNKPATIQEVQEAGSNNHALGACLAACNANAELFRFVTGQRSADFCKWHSLWTDEVYGYLPGASAAGPDILDLRLGRLHLVGCGAIGSSFAFIFPFLHCNADFLFVDPDAVEAHNTSSSMLFTAQDAEHTRDKVATCSGYLAEFGLAGKQFKDDYNNWPYTHGDVGISGADVILCFANENNIWSTIQYLYPPVCFHATTSKSWGVHVGRHIPLKENCIMCTFQDILLPNRKTTCAEVAIVEATDGGETNSHTAILPFLAPAAAIITAAEVIKLAMHKHGHGNTTIFNLGTPDAEFITDYRSFGNCFICEQQGVLYDKFGAGSKYWPLSKSQII